MDWVISSRVPNRERFNDYPVARSRKKFRRTVCLNLLYINNKHGKDIVYSLQKYKVVKKIDFGSILLPVKSSDLEKLQPILDSGVFEKPVLKLSIYKNRRGRYKGIYLWCKANLGTCRINPMFATTYDYEIISIDDMKIIVEDAPSAF